MTSGAYPKSDLQREKMSKAHRKKPANETSFQKGHKAWNQGKALTSEHKNNLKKFGNSNPNWRGGITKLIFLIRTSFKYRQWRSDVFTRDNFTCQDCGDKTGGNLEAHHIFELHKIIKKYGITTIEQALACEELWNINNGQTLCSKCHNKTKRKS